MSACGLSHAAKVTTTGTNTTSAISSAASCHPLGRENAKTPNAGVSWEALTVGGKFDMPPYIKALFVTNAIHQFYGGRL